MVTVVTCNSLNSQKFDSQRNIFKSIINEKGKTLFPEKLKKRCWFEMKTCILLSIYHVLFDSLIHLLSKTIFQKFKLEGGGYNCYEIGYGLLGITQKHEQDLGSFHLKVSTPRKKTFRKANICETPNSNTLPWLFTLRRRFFVLKKQNDYLINHAHGTTICITTIIS